MVADFSNIKAQGVKEDATREYFFDVLVGEPSVVLAPAHDSNPAFLDERLRMSAERANAIGNDPAVKPRSSKVTADDLKKKLDEDRDADRVIIAKVCAKRWGTAPVDAKGKPVEFSEENCLAFFRALPDFVFDPFRNYASNIYNFVDKPRAADQAGAAALGESQPGG